MPTDTPDLVLDGCRPTPLASYLKSLAVLRLLGAHRRDLRASWRGEHFAIAAPGMDAKGILRFFLDEYAPTPAVSPWNGGSGFHSSDRTDALVTIERSADVRWAAYRRAIAAARGALAVLRLEAKPTDAKPALLRLCRATLPDEALAWLDACVVFATQSPAFMPLLGTGGNDGRLDFSNNFMQQLVRCLASDRRTESAHNLCQALFATADGPLAYSDASLGQFYPGAVGGPGSAAGGYEGTPTVNPWDYVLAMEGAMAFGGAVSRRLRSTGAGRHAAFPFTVAASAVGSAPLSEVEAAKARAEVWLPLWERPATWSEIQFLMSEGRAQWGGRPARDAVEFAEATVNLGVDRGIAAFARTALLERNGRSFLAVDLARVKVETFAGADALQDPEYRAWVERFRDVAARDRAPATWRAAWRVLESAIYQACAAPGQAPRGRLQRVLTALAGAHAAVASRVQRHGVPPIELGERWLDACGDESPEWRLAVALAGVVGRGAVPSLRAHIEPVRQRRSGGWEWDDRSRAVVWRDAIGLYGNLEAILAQRLMLAREDGLMTMPLASTLPAAVDDVHALLDGRLDETRLARLVRAVALVRHGKETVPTATTDALPPDLSRVYALLKQVFSPWPVAEGLALLPPTDVLPRLRARDVAGAARSVARHLQAHQVPLRFTRPDPGWIVPPSTAQRMSAALLVPVQHHRALHGLVIRL